MAVVDYQDFELEISSHTTGGSQEYFGKVIRSPAGEAPRCPVKFWFSEPGVLAKLRTDLESAVLEIDEKNHLGLSSRAEMVLRNFGREIFRSIFVNTSSINEIYVRSKGVSRDLRIKLRIESQELAGLPWEYLYEEKEIPGYVSLRLPVVRYLETMGSAGRMGVKGPLRILGMISDPATDVWPKLNVVRERDRINKGIDSLEREGRVDFQWVAGGTGKDLMNKLLEEEWHVFHFIGHGGVEAAVSDGDAATASFDESGFIVMVDENGEPVKKFASDLATMLLGARNSLRLVVLNCCESAKINVGERFGNPAIGLMRSGWLPAVVAMQFPITDGAAIRMSEGFYKALANNQPVDGAVTVARQFIQDQSKVEWGIPVLYMRSIDGKIFDVDNPFSARAGANGAGKLSGEDLNQRRQDFLLAMSQAQNSAEELEQLTFRGQKLLQHFKGDQELAAHLAKIYFDLGLMQQRQKQIPKASASFNYAVKLDPTKPEYYVRRANFNAMLGLFENALTDITEAIKLRPDNAELYWVKGIICSMASGSENTRGFVEEAINSYSIAISKNPQEPKYLISRANAYAQLKRKAEATNDIDKAITLAPDNADFMAQKARIANQMA
jgi:tetratricopeptide (TPR) repeat protein